MQSVGVDLKPWTAPLDLNLLLSQSYQFEDRVTGKREGVRKMQALRTTSLTDSTVLQCAQKAFDFEAQFRNHHAANDEEEDNVDIDPALRERIAQLQKKFDRHASRSIPVQVSTSQKERRERGKAKMNRHKQSRPESFFRSIPSTIRAFLSKPLNSQRDSEVPVRFNRLHGANDSSMSGLSPDVRRDFVKMSRLSHRHGAFQRRARSVVVDFKDTEHHTSDRARSIVKNRSQNQPSTVEIHSTQSVPTQSRSPPQACSFVLEDGNSASHVASQDSSQILELADDDERGCSDVSQESIDARSAISFPNRQKRAELPLNVSDLIQQYNRAESSKRNHGLREGNSTPPSSVILETNFNIANVKALFEKESQAKRETTQDVPVPEAKMRRTKLASAQLAVDEHKGRGQCLTVSDISPATSAEPQSPVTSSETVVKERAVTSDFTPLLQHISQQRRVQSDVFHCVTALAAGCTDHISHSLRSFTAPNTTCEKESAAKNPIMRDQWQACAAESTALRANVVSPEDPVAVVDALWRRPEKLNLEGLFDSVGLSPDKSVSRREENFHTQQCGNKQSPQEVAPKSPLVADSTETRSASALFLKGKGYERQKAARSGMSIVCERNEQRCVSFADGRSKPLAGTPRSRRHTINTASRFGRKDKEDDGVRPRVDVWWNVISALDY